MKSLLNVNFFTWSHFISHVVCLGKTSNSWYKYLGPYLKSEILQYAHNFQFVQSSIFLMENIFFPILWEILKFEVMEYLICYVKFEMWAAFTLSYFQQWNLN